MFLNKYLESLILKYLIMDDKLKNHPVVDDVYQYYAYLKNHLFQINALDSKMLTQLYHLGDAQEIQKKLKLIFVMRRIENISDF